MNVRQNVLFSKLAIKRIDAARLQQGKTSDRFSSYFSIRQKSALDVGIVASGFCPIRLLTFAVSNFLFWKVELFFSAILFSLAYGT